MTASDVGRMTIEEVGSAGRAHFTRLTHDVLKPEHKGLFVAIDVLSGEFEIDRDDDTAVRRMRTRKPDSEVYLTRAGFGYAHSIGYFE